MPDEAEPAAVAPPSRGRQPVALVHTPGMRVPHDRLKVTLLRQVPTHNGVAFTAVLCLDGKPVGTIENSGNGGPSTLYSTNSRFGWRAMRDYVHACRLHGEPACEEDVLDALVDEYDIGRTVSRAHAAGGTVARLLDGHGHTLDLTAVRRAPRSDTDRAALARQLTRQRSHPEGVRWLIWSGTAWVTLADLAAPDNQNQ